LNIPFFGVSSIIRQNIETYIFNISNKDFAIPEKKDILKYSSIDIYEKKYGYFINNYLNDSNNYQ